MVRGGATARAARNVPHVAGEERKQKCSAGEKAREESDAEGVQTNCRCEL